MKNIPLFILFLVVFSNASAGHPDEDVKFFEDEVKIFFAAAAIGTILYLAHNHKEGAKEESNSEFFSGKKITAQNTLTYDATLAKRKIQLMFSYRY